MTRLPGLSAYDRQQDATPHPGPGVVRWRLLVRRAVLPRLARQGRWSAAPAAGEEPTVSGFDVTVIVLAVLAEPLIGLAMLAGLVKLGLLTAHLHKPEKLPPAEK